MDIVERRGGISTGKILILLEKSKRLKSVGSGVINCTGLFEQGEQVPVSVFKHPARECPQGPMTRTAGKRLPSF